MLFRILKLFSIVYIVSGLECNLPQETINEIHSHQYTVNRIIQETTGENGKFKGKVYDLVAEWTDKFGSRLVGTQNLENSIDDLVEMMGKNDVEDIHTENVTVPHWERHLEECQMIKPRVAKVPILAFGSSVGTPEGGIEAEAVVVRDFSDLINNYNHSVKGKIVIYNYKYTTYWLQVNYREQGAFHAAQYGAVAALVRSVTPFSLRTLHTGMNHYRSNVTKIPAVAITAEDAHMFQRIQDRGQKIVLKLNVQATQYEDAISRNIIGDHKGSQSPEKVVIVSGHSDSWDVGHGVMDDAAGAFVSWYALSVLKGLNLRALRTVRAIIWVSEENRLSGALDYFERHKAEFDNFMFMMESDEGTFTPLGLKYLAGNNGGCILQEVMKLLAPINTTRAEYFDDVGADIEIWNKIVPCGSLYNQNDKYFWYHHTEADTIDVEDPDDLDKAVALFASVSYVLANLKADFPRD